MAIWPGSVFLNPFTSGQPDLEFMDDLQLETLEGVSDQILDRSEAAMRSAFRAMPDGVYESTVDCDGIEETMHYPIRVTVAGDAIEVDLDGAPPQTERASATLPVCIREMPPMVATMPATGSTVAPAPMWAPGRTTESTTPASASTTPPSTSR